MIAIPHSTRLLIYNAMPLPLPYYIIMFNSYPCLFLSLFFLFFFFSSTQKIMISFEREMNLLRVMPGKVIVSFIFFFIPTIRTVWYGTVPLRATSKLHKLSFFFGLMVP